MRMPRDNVTWAEGPAGRSCPGTSHSCSLFLRCATELLAALGSVLVLALSAEAHAALPTGYLDGADCDTFAGWTQDPDEPDKSIDVHLYLGGPAGSGAPAVAINANVHREDLCAAIGSCAHGFYQATPYSLLDGSPRPIHAYAIDSMGGPNPELGNSPRTLQCVPAVAGVKRTIAGVSTYDDWGFDPTWDVVAVAPPSATGLPVTQDWPAVPRLVQDSAGAKFLLDDIAYVKRPVSDTALAFWHLGALPVEMISDADLAAWIDGTPLRARPMLVIQGALFVIDDEQPQGMAPPTSSTSSGMDDDDEDGSGGASASGGGGAGGTSSVGAGGGSTSDGAGCNVGSARSTSSNFLAVFVLALSVFLRRRATREPLAEFGTRALIQINRPGRHGRVLERRALVDARRPVADLLQVVECDLGGCALAVHGGRRMTGLTLSEDHALPEVLVRELRA